MKQIKLHKRVWDHLEVWICETGKLFLSSSRYAKGQTALEIITVKTSDISEYLYFLFYDWVTYWTTMDRSIA